MTISLQYNPSGQIWQRTISNNAYVYDETNSDVAHGVNGLNQLTGAGLTYDTQANLTSDGTRTFGYDALGRLRSSPGLGQLVYDPADRLFSEAAGDVRFLWDGFDLIGEYDATGVLTRRYVHGPAFDEPLTWWEGGGLTDRRWFVADERGSNLGAADGAGVSLSINTYGDFGQPGPANTGRFGYTSQLWLPQMGVYHYRSRAYHPGLGRFMQPDPIGYDGGMNLYAYVGTDPLNLVDPLGLDSIFRCSSVSDYGIGIQGNCGWVEIPSGNGLSIPDTTGGYKPGLQPIPMEGLTAEGLREACRNPEIDDPVVRAIDWFAGWVASPLGRNGTVGLRDTVNIGPVQMTFGMGIMPSKSGPASSFVFANRSVGTGWGIGVRSELFGSTRPPIQAPQVQGNYGRVSLNPEAGTVAIPIAPPMRLKLPKKPTGQVRTTSQIWC